MNPERKTSRELVQSLSAQEINSTQMSYFISQLKKIVGKKEIDVMVKRISVVQSNTKILKDNKYH